MFWLIARTFGWDRSKNKLWLKFSKTKCDLRAGLVAINDVRNSLISYDNNKYFASSCKCFCLYGVYSISLGEVDVISKTACEGIATMLNTFNTPCLY